MGTILRCGECKKTDHYDSDEVGNMGTVWHPIWAVKCHNCGTQITFEVGDGGFAEALDKALSEAKGICPKDGGLEFKYIEPKKGSARERAESSDIREYWIQKYVRKNYKRLGFSKIQGPFDIGPDFKGVYKGKEVLVEVERDCQSFVQHEHHKDKRFEGVCILIVLNSSEPAKEIRDKLPETIIPIDIDDFVKWWYPKARAYAEKKEKERPCRKMEAVIQLIANEFQARFIRDCPDKGRDMSTCPECDLCAYFGEGTAYEASSIFREMALRFIPFIGMQLHRMISVYLSLSLPKSIPSMGSTYLNTCEGQYE